MHQYTFHYLNDADLGAGVGMPRGIVAPNLGVGRHQDDADAWSVALLAWGWMDVWGALRTV